MSQEVVPQPPKNRVRWGWIIAGAVIAIIVSSFFIREMEGTVQYYMTVSEYLGAQSKYEGKKIKIAGKVKTGSLQHSDDLYTFLVEDLGQEIRVRYRGLAPDTFKEGVEVVVEGRGKLGDEFEATGLMAKCASKYQEGGMPPLEKMRSQSIH